MGGPRASRYLPARTREIAQALEEHFFPADDARRAFRDVSRLVEDHARHASGNEERLLEDLYAPFDPTDDAPRPRLSDDDVASATESFFDRLKHLLDRANFDVVPIDELRRVEPHDSVPKELQIDPGFEQIDRVLVAVRGVGRKAVVIRPWHKLFTRVETDTPTYLRVFVALRRRGERLVHMRLYRDVAMSDLDLLLPTVSVRMRFLDKLKLSGSGGASAVAAFRLVRLAIFYAAKIAFLQVIMLPLIVLVGGVYGGKTFLDYTKIRVSYLTELARHLYELSVATDRAVLARLAQMSAEEEAKEILLAWAFLHAAGPEGRTPSELDDGVKAWLRARLGESVWFDIGDALSMLDERGLLKPRVEGTRARIAVSPVEACQALDKAWDDLYTPPAT